jgi:hypothetical protein
MYAFHAGICEPDDTQARFRVVSMITHLQRDLGVRYRPALVANPDAMIPADSFLHGIIQGDGGSCGNLPILYAAVGRRLGYPIKLVTTRSHLFARWDARPHDECFNIEAAGQGVSFLPDSHSRRCGIANAAARPHLPQPRHRHSFRHFHAIAKISSPRIDEHTSVARRLGKPRLRASLVDAVANKPKHTAGRYA